MKLWGKIQIYLSSEKQDELFYKKLWTTIRNRQVWRGEIINQHKNGNQYFEEMTITPVFDQDDQINNFVAVKQNITCRKRREQELEAIAAMTSALRNAVTQNDILQAFLGNLLEISQGTGAIISLVQPGRKEETVIVSGAGEWDNLTEKRLYRLMPEFRDMSLKKVKSTLTMMQKIMDLFYFPEALKKVEAIAAAPLSCRKKPLAL